MKQARITGVGSYLPERIVTNDDLSKTLDTSDEWIVSHTGISTRHLAAPGETTSAMGIAAAKRAMADAGVKAEDIGMVILATSTPDHGDMPATACDIQHGLGAVNAGAFDMIAACSGFVYGLEVARGLIQCSDRPVLVIGSERMSSIVDWTDRNTCILFGDAAGAVVLESCEAKGHRFYGSVLCSDGSGAGMLVRDGGAWMEEDGQLVRPGTVQMQGRPVFNFAVRALPRIATELLTRHGFEMNDLTHIVAHQANLRIIDAAARRLDVPRERFYLNVQDVANTSSASIPLALDHMNDEGLLKEGDLVLTVAFGAGLLSGGNLFRW
jgi:3-oxoacyl-[acyl-carrier-protein] synthase III